jgi:phage baseplate assembly protein W
MAITAVYSDIDIELSQATDGDILRDIEEEAIINSITNIINTLQGSRRMLPEFAASMQKILFEPIDENTASLIKHKLFVSINRWDDRVIAETIYVDPKYDQNMYKCLLNFRIKGFDIEGITRSIRFILRRA